jgi:polyribonucleotide nucleotidyltransferase
MFHVVDTSFEVDGRTISLETGRLARQAAGAVLVRQGGAAVLATAVVGDVDKRGGSGDDDFVPLTVEYREKLAAAGRIPGSFQRREGRITDDEVLVSRLLDRSLRPLFPKRFAREIQVQTTVLSAEPARVETGLLALIGAAAALHLSPIPWHGPLAGARLVRVDGRWLAFPAPSERARADVDLVVSLRREGLVMVEGGARQTPEAELLEGLLAAPAKLAPVIAALAELRAKAGRPKIELAPRPEPPRHVALRAAIEREGPARLRPLL